MNEITFNLSLLAALTGIAAAGLALAVFLVKRLDRQSDITMMILEKLADRDFHAKYSEEREKTEYAIARLNEKLTDTKPEFNAVNHLIVDGQRRVSSIDRNPIDVSSFLESMQINEIETQYEDDLVFVLTPFHPREKLTYSAIVEAFENFPVRVQRGDEDNIRTEILSHIVQKIVSARLIIANISSRNPNVMYELGIAHALGKKVIVISSNEDEIPFDFRSRRLLFYKSRNDLISKLKEEIARKLFSGAL
jgi:hypothetical protein